MMSPASRDGIEAFVRRVEGQRFNEYEIVQRKDLGNKPATTIGYLESEENVEFEVGVLFHEKALTKYTDHDWNYKVSVDGRESIDVACDRNDPGLRVSQMRYIKRGQKMRGSLCFTTLPTTDDDSLVTLRGKDLEEIGNIQIDMYRGVQGGLTGEHYDTTYLVSHELGFANERDKKWSAAVGVGDVSPDSDQNSVRVQWREIDGNKPYHRFIFQYRTRAVLELLRIVGRPKSLSSPLKSSGSKRKPETIYIADSDEEDFDRIIETKASRATPAPRIASPALPTPPRRAMPEFDTRPRKRTKRDIKPDIAAGQDVKPLLKSMSQMTLGYPRTGKRSKTPNFIFKS